MPQYYSIKKLLRDINTTLAHAKTPLTNFKFNITTEEDQKSYPYWPLFFCKPEDDCCSLDIDCCSLSIAIRLISLSRQSLTQEQTDNLNSAILLLLKMRNNNGSWPSIFQNNSNKISAEGVINDTVIALEALLDYGFLEDESCNAVFKDLQNIATKTDRINFFYKSIEWLLNNKIEAGWYYTTTEYIVNKNVIHPATQPTAATLLLLYRAYLLFYKIKDDRKNDIFASYNSGCRVLIEMTREDGGMGKNNTDVSRIVHTCLAFTAIAINKETPYNQQLQTMLSYIVNNSSPHAVTKLTSDDYFDTYNQNIITTGNKLKYRQINHETCPEATIAEAYSLSIENPLNLGFSSVKKYKFYRNFRYLATSIMSAQTKTGDFTGAFKCKRLLKHEFYPIYTLWNSTKVLSKMQQRHEYLSQKYYIYLNILIFLLTCAIILGILKITNNTIDTNGVIASIVASIICSSFVLIYQYYKSK